MGANNPVLRSGMDIPACSEIARMSVEALFSFLIDWMWESPSELIPSNEQIAQVRALLLQRHDALQPDVQRLIDECNAYLKE
ncbi:hypothetical protein ACVCL0_14910 [Rhodanobacter sp. UC4450_H17]